MGLVLRVLRGDGREELDLVLRCLGVVRRTLHDLQSVLTRRVRPAHSSYDDNDGRIHACQKPSRLLKNDPNPTF